jgi:hypothetical protein
MLGSADPTTTVLRLLLIAAPIGALDVLWFHIYKLRLYSRRESVLEELTHLVRGAMFPIFMTVLLVGRPEGAWFWVLTGAFTVDFANSLVDVLAEPSSRAPVGVPRAELAVHVIGGTLTTAAFTLFVAGAWSSQFAPTALIPHASGWLTPLEIGLAWSGIAGGVLVFVTEAALFACAVLERSPPDCPVRRFCNLACPVTSAS